MYEIVPEHSEFRYKSNKMKQHNKFRLLYTIKKTKKFCHGLNCTNKEFCTKSAASPEFRHIAVQWQGAAEFPRKLIPKCE